MNAPAATNLLRLSEGKRGRPGLLLVLLVVLATVACKSGSSGEAFLNRGKDLAEKKEYARALIEFRNAARIQPKSAKPYYQLGLTYLNVGDARAAYVSFQKSVQIDPNHSGAQIKLAEMLATNDDKDRRKEAEERIKGVLERQPGNPDALTTLGVIRITSGDRKAGEDQFRAALQSAPTNLRAALLLSKMRLAEEDFAGAEKVLNPLPSAIQSRRTRPWPSANFMAASKGRMKPCKNTNAP